MEVSLKYLIILSLLFTSCAHGPCRGVIGAGYDTRTGVVDYIYPNSPARKIGIEAGDTLINTWQWSGDAGDIVTIQFIRNNVLVMHSATLVCVDKLMEW